MSLYSKIVHITSRFLVASASTAFHKLLMTDLSDCVTTRRSSDSSMVCTSVYVYGYVNMPTYFCICFLLMFEVTSSIYVYIILQLSGTFGDTNLGNFNSDTECLLGNDHSLQRPARFVLKAVSSSRYVLYYYFLKKYALE